ncbi:sodium:solute symporter family protein [Candidatus Ichthyocystis hellenicum]|uniref:sodium:solute symporter family protein n=1 Tax=Candidatus Ichthyocystis hellenicum TaxID=1561003 RepID=UPI000B83B6D9|nr:sodium:solute symporter family protein [Candidatus Ichthyocystis hellenicum]
MILFLIFVYICIVMAVSTFAARRVKSLSDYMHASGKYNLPTAVATTFASWFGASSMLAAPAVFISRGTSGVIADPYASTACCIFLAISVAKHIFRSNVYTIGDFYRKRYNSTIEAMSSFVIVLSYLGWISGVITCIGLVLDVLSGRRMGIPFANTLAAIMICLYGIRGGMWSLALADCLQFTVIVSGLLFLLGHFSHKVGGFGVLVSHAIEQGRYVFFPDHSISKLLLQFSDFAGLFIGLIPQQDLFQRIAACRNENVAARSFGIMSVIYVIMSNVPMLIAFSATLLAPGIVSYYTKIDSQLILPEFLLSQTSLVFQAAFFGALFAGLLSGGGTALLAPATTIAKNVFCRVYKDLTDNQVLFISRCCIFFLAASQLFVTLVAKKSIYSIILDSYSVTSVAAAVPLLAGFFWKKANSQGAFLSIFLGFISWVIAKFCFVDLNLPSTLIGVLSATLGIVIGSSVPTIKCLCRFVHDGV